MGVSQTACKVGTKYANRMMLGPLKLSNRLEKLLESWVIVGEV